MRVIPYQTDAPDTSGIIISFVDISDLKKANNQGEGTRFNVFKGVLIYM
jgi:hypothetical protein